MAWSTGITLRGAAGAQVRYGHGAPSTTNPSVQNDGDSYIDVDAGRLYAVRASGTWPTTYASLVGPQGGTVRVGSGPPTSSNPATQGDTDVYVQLDATNGPALWGPRANGAWPSSSTTLAGAAGKSVLSGSQAPTASDGVDGQPAFIDTANGVLYGPKSNGAWPSSGVSLKGPQGTRIYYDTAQPGITLGLVSDLFIRTTTYDLYAKITNTVVNTTPDYPNGWQIIGNLKGATGAASTVAGPQGSPGAPGLSVVSNTAAPTNADGVVGSPAFVNTAAGTLYGAKTSSGWPSSFTSLVGPVGPAGAGGYTGSGAPSASNPGGTIVAGSFYLQTDVTPYRLFVPYSTANGWPSTYTAMGGGSFLTTSGPPASTLGAVGDVAIDLTNALFYPPKTSGGWIVAPINLVGPTGAPGPTTSYRHVLQGYMWLVAAPTAGTAYPVATAIVGNNNQSLFYFPVTLPMYAAGSLTAISAYSVAGPGASSITFTILKNGTALYTATSFITIGATAATAYRVLPTNGLTFAAGDIISITGTPSTANGNQSVAFNLFYTTNS